MPLAIKNRPVLITAALVVVIVVFVFSTTRSTIDFNTQVKPILNDNCISCHGGVKKQGGFSLLFHEEALAKLKSGRYGIIPGDPRNSEMIRRINLKDPEERMPYQHDPLSEDDIDILTKWVKQGAKWGKHWAYEPVKQVQAPKAGGWFGWGGGSKWVKNDIDQFIYEKLEEQDLTPSKEANKATLLRRASLDLTGLPASPALAKWYLSNKNEHAYEQLVDTLLSMPAYGERWTAVWLDLARYADTKGYEKDDGRNIWQYRDWLIKALNSDKPYDVFLIEQLAGDLLPNATDEQFIATAFNRNTMTNDEGGTDNEEFRTAAIIDRVNTTWQSLLGTTFACVQCHSHPYDPFTHEEYYKFMAFFNNTRDEDTHADYPLLRHYAAEDSLKLQKVISWLKQNNYHNRADEIYRFTKTWQPAVNSLKADQFVNADLNDTKWLALRNNATARLPAVGFQQSNHLLYRYRADTTGGIWTIRLDDPNGPVLKRIALEKTKGWEMATIDFPEQTGTHDLYFSYTNPNLQRPTQNGVMFDWFYFTQPFPGKGAADYDSIKSTWWNLVTKKVPTTPVMMDNPAYMQRNTQVFVAGNWMVKGDQVQPGVPNSLNSFPANSPNNRLGLARWITDKNNPLTARTMVNRLWEQLFGTGLVETLEDMGTKGADPTHQQLLDHLSWQFMNEYKWSTKRLLKQMVMSATYRQSSTVSDQHLKSDQYNRYFARGVRMRLSAEQVRDQALFVSGKMSAKMYGPGIKPWQPQGIWLSPYSGEYWNISEGEDRYRRALYTYWKRTAPYPSMIAFDGVGREVCTSRRIRTNTPLQALVTLNDSAYLDLSGHFARRIQRETGKNDAKVWIAKGYELLMMQPIAEEKSAAMLRLYNTALQKFSIGSKAMEFMRADGSNASAEEAALIVVANALLNLDEVLTKS